MHPFGHCPHSWVFSPSQLCRHWGQEEGPLGIRQVLLSTCSCGSSSSSFQSSWCLLWYCWARLWLWEVGWETWVSSSHCPGQCTWAGEGTSASQPGSDVVACTSCFSSHCGAKEQSRNEVSEPHPPGMRCRCTPA